MRKSSFFLFCIGVQLVLLGSVFIHANFQEKTTFTRLREEARMVKDFGLTDLCLFTEASYTRHLSLADLHTPFQDAPMALEHFPSGSLVFPPRLIKRADENMD